MKSTILSVIVLGIAGAITAPAHERQARPIQVATTCFKTGEQVSGMNKICYYNCLGSEAAITVSAASLCPLSINR